jgi:hypothetical protein
MALNFKDKTMSTEPINYEAVIADLEAKKAQIDAAIQAIKAVAGMGSLTSLGSASTSTQGIPSDAFLSMSIPDATKKLLGMVKKKLSTQDVMKYLEMGGMPPLLYNTVYGVLRRRQNQIGDIVNMGGDWGLKDWYPNFKPKQKAAKEDESGGPEEEVESPDIGSESESA